MISDKAKDDFRLLVQELIKAGRIDLEGLEKDMELEENNNVA